MEAQQVETGGISLVLAQSSCLLTQALAAFLQSAGMDVRGSATVTGELYELVEEHRPDVLLVGVPSRGETPTAILEKVRERWPELAVLAFLEDEDSRTSSPAAPPWATGVVSMDMSCADLLHAIGRAGQGQMVRVTSPRPAPRSHEDFLLEQLTARELQVLEFLTEGADSQTIARQLDISTNTVRTHVQNILSKLHVNSRLGAASLAIRRGRATNRVDP